MNLEQTLDDDQWVRAHEDQIREMLPETWTHVSNIDQVRFGFRMKVLGIDWKSYADLGAIFAALERKRIMIRDGVIVRYNPARA